MRTELIKKLKALRQHNNLFLHDKLTINEAIALLEKPRFSAEEIEKQALERYPIEMVSIYTKKDLVDKNAERRIIFIEAYTQAMHDYAGQSDAEQKKKHAIEFKTYIDDVEQFSLRTLSDEERYNEYQAFLNREEK